MPVYSVVLMVHVLAVFAMTAVLTLEAFSLSRLRRSSTPAEALAWIDIAPMLPVVGGGSALIILLSGIYLVSALSRGAAFWPRVAAIALLSMAPLAAGSNRRIRRLRELCSTRNQFDTTTLEIIQSPLLNVSLWLRIAVFLGIFLLVSVEPGPGTSVLMIAGAVISGLLASRSTMPSNSTSITTAK